jgi:hypothetical protein
MTPHPNDLPSTGLAQCACGFEFGAPGAEVEKRPDALIDDNGYLICETCDQAETDAFWAEEGRQMDYARFGN